MSPVGVRIYRVDRLRNGGTDVSKVIIDFYKLPCKCDQCILNNN